MDIRIGLSIRTGNDIKVSIISLFDIDFKSNFSFLIMSSLLRDAEVLRDAEEPEPT